MKQPENFELNARHVKAALIVAPKDDVRYYLNGLFIHNGKIVSTDGHRMLVIDSAESEFISNLIVAVLGNIPAKAVKCKFNFTSESGGYISMTNRHDVELDQLIKFNVLEGSYPDYTRVMPSGNRDKQDQLGFNFEYLAEVAKIANSLGSKCKSGVFNFYSCSQHGGKVTTININGPYGQAVYVVMGTRL